MADLPEQQARQTIDAMLAAAGWATRPSITACAFTYRLIKFAKAKCELFLVDRANLGRQAKTEFDQYVQPDDFCRVTICTIQRLYSCTPHFW